MYFRLLIQPATAIFLAIRAGWRDARQKKPAFLWEVVTNPAARRELIQSAWKDIGRLFIFAFLLDTAYQFIVFQYFYPVQALIVSFALAVVPYVLLRGPVTRLLRKWS
jgi:hypothetical protein